MLGLGIDQQFDFVGVSLNNVIKQGVLQQGNKLAKTIHQCIKTVYFGNVIIYKMDLGVRVTKVTNGCAFSKKRVYESVNVLERAIRADFVSECFMEVCRTGRLMFSLSFLHILSALFDIQMKRNRRTHEFIIRL